MKNQKLNMYSRLVKSSEVEQILSQCRVYIELNILRPYVINSKSKSGDLYKIVKNAAQNSSYISTEYDSKLNTTARIFTKRGSINLITLNDTRVLSAMKSRYPDGRMVVLDYQNFEPSIIKGRFVGDVFPDDLHGWSLRVLDIPRKIAKQYNMALLYGKDFKMAAETISVDLLKTYECEPDNIMQYIEKMLIIRTKVEKEIEPLLESYDNQGFVLNAYGRKIYPKKRSNIFNNVVQSIGSEILIEAIVELNEFLGGKEAHLLFHRFDALYFDMSKDALFKHLNGIVRIMESVDDSTQLRVGIQIGKDLTSLEDLNSG